MRKRLLFLGCYLLVWMLYFILFRMIFLAYHYPQLSVLSFSDIFGIFINASSLDLSSAAYLSIIPFLLVMLSSIFSPHIIRPIMKGYTFVLITLVSLIQTIDLEVFRAWGFHLDNTPLMYLNSPGEMIASSLSSPLWLLFFILFVVCFAFCYMAGKWIDKSFRNMQASKIYWAPLYLGLTALLIIPMRGGLQLAPINQSSVYFSTIPFANQASINPFWNFMFSLLEESNSHKGNPYTMLPQEEANQLVKSMYSCTSADSTSNLLNTKRPNIVLIIWESFTAKAVAALDGKPGVTPHFNNLVKEGVLFSHMYATGTRSDKGLAGILSGYPAQPTESIINIPDKSRNLSGLPNTLKDYGYNSAYYYGGEIDFFNMKSYMLNIGFQQLVSEKDFDKKDMNSKWGAHDHVVFNRLANDLKTPKEPFFHTIFTLSSHEPFEVPMDTKIEGDDEESKFLNSLYYTDSALSSFIKQIKQEKWYENTLVIITADHGHRMPNQSMVDHPDMFHIPMLWLGGALAKQDTVIEEIGSQVDLPATILNQLGIPDKDYPWSKNILNQSAHHFAQCHFHDGSLLISQKGELAFDEKGKVVTYANTEHLDSLKKLTIAHLESSFQDYLNK